MSNKTYDILKIVALIVLPALSTAVLSLSDIWGFPYGVETAKTISILAVFLGSVLGVSSKQYKEKNERRK